MKLLKINSKNFELIKPKQLPNYNDVAFHSRWDLFSFYGRPSQRKIDIWSDWIEWFCDTDGISNYYVSSAGSSTFAITASYRDSEGNKYIMYITKSHNRIYPCSR